MAEQPGPEVLRENNYQKRRPVAEVAVGAPEPTQGDPLSWIAHSELDRIFI